jgi:hypothetical protein
MVVTDFVCIASVTLRLRPYRRDAERLLSDITHKIGRARGEGLVPEGH